MQGEAGVGAERCEEASAEVPVQFDGIKLTAAGDQCLGERTLAGANFDKVIGIGRCNRPRNRLDNGLIAEKVLAEALAGCVWHIRK